MPTLSAFHIAYIFSAEYASMVENFTSVALKLKCIRYPYFHVPWFANHLAVVSFGFPGWGPWLRIAYNMNQILYSINAFTFFFDRIFAEALKDPSPEAPPGGGQCQHWWCRPQYHAHQVCQPWSPPTVSIPPSVWIIEGFRLLKSCLMRGFLSCVQPIPRIVVARFPSDLPA